MVQPCIQPKRCKYVHTIQSMTAHTLEPTTTTERSYKIFQCRERKNHLPFSFTSHASNMQRKGGCGTPQCCMEGGYIQTRHSPMNIGRGLMCCKWRRNDKEKAREKQNARKKNHQQRWVFWKPIGGLGRRALADKLHKCAKLPQLLPCTPYQGNDT